MESTILTALTWLTFGKYWLNQIKLKDSLSPSVISKHSVYVVNLGAYFQGLEGSMRMVNFIPCEFGTWRALLTQRKWRDVNQTRLWFRHWAPGESGSEFTVIVNFISSKLEYNLRSGHLHVDMLWSCLFQYVQGETYHLSPKRTSLPSLPYISSLLADIYYSLFPILTHSTTSFHTHIPMLKNKSVASHGQQGGEYLDLCVYTHTQKFDICRWALCFLFCILEMTGLTQHHIKHWELQMKPKSVWCWDTRSYHSIRLFKDFPINIILIYQFLHFLLAIKHYCQL